MKYNYQKLTGYPYTPNQWGKYYLCDMDTDAVYIFETAKQGWNFTVHFHKEQLSNAEHVSSLVLVLGRDIAFSFPGFNSPVQETAEEFNLSADSRSWLQRSRFNTIHDLYRYAFTGAGFDDYWQAFEGLNEVRLLEILNYCVRYSGYNPKFWDCFDTICEDLSLRGPRYGVQGKPGRICNVYIVSSKDYGIERVFDTPESAVKYAVTIGVQRGVLTADTVVYDNKRYDFAPVGDRYDDWVKYMEGFTIDYLTEVAGGEIEIEMRHIFH